MHLRIAIWIVAIGMGWSTGNGIADSIGPAMTVNGHPVSQDAYRWYQAREKTAIIQAVLVRYGLCYGHGFWQMACGGTTPGQMILEKTVEVVIHDTCERQLFEQLGLIGDISFESFQEQLSQINLQRQERFSRGEVVYGPIIFTQEQFYDHWMAQLRIKAQERLAANVFVLTEQALRDFYESDDSSYYVSVSTWSLELISLGDADGRSEVTGEMVLLADKEWDELKRDNAGGYIRLERTSEDRLAERFVDPQVLERVMQLSTGQAVLLSVKSEGRYAIRCIDHHPVVPKPFDEVRDQVRARFVEHQYQSLLNAKVQAVRATLNGPKPPPPPS